MTSTIAASKDTDFASSIPSAPLVGEAHVVPLAYEQRLEDLPHDLFVVDDQDGTVTPHVPQPCRGRQEPAPRSSAPPGLPVRPVLREIRG